MGQAEGKQALTQRQQKGRTLSLKLHRQEVAKAASGTTFQQRTCFSTNHLDPTVTTTISQFVMTTG